MHPHRLYSTPEYTVFTYCYMYMYYPLFVLLPVVVKKTAPASANNTTTNPS